MNFSPMTQDKFYSPSRTMQNEPKTNGKRWRISASRKLEILEIASATSVESASAQCGVSPSSIRAWRKLKQTLAEQPPSTKRLSSHRTCTVKPLQSSPPHQGKTMDRSDRTERTRTLHITDPNSATSQAIVTTMSRCTSPIRAESHIDDGRTLNSVQLIGFQGERHEFSDMAARQTVGALTGGTLADREFELTGYPSVVRVLDALHEGDISYAFVSSDVLQSTNFGVVIDRVMTRRFTMVGEVGFSENVCACALPDTILSETDCVMSDWNILCPCEDYILQLETRFKQSVLRQTVWDSATACRMVREEGAMNTLVLCSEQAARENGLVLLERVSSNRGYSKYAIIGRHGAASFYLRAEAVERYSRQSSLVLSTRGRVDISRLINAFSSLKLSI